MSRADVIGAGACSPVGFDARQTALGVRARKLTSRPMALLDKNGARFGSARALGMPEDLFGPPRIVKLASRALREAAKDAGVAHDKPVRVFLGVAERGRPHVDDQEIAARVLLPAIEKESGQKIDGAASEVLRVGHAGMAIALERAMAAGGSSSEPIFVGCVDSYHHPEMMRWLEKELRALGDTIHNAFIPSEGAAFLAIGGSDKPDRRPFAKITHAIAGVEQIAEGEPRLAELMTDLVRGGAAKLGRHVPWVITDVNGERHRTKEWTFVTIRNKDTLHPGETREEHMGQLIGDAGAATGALGAVYAAIAFRTGFATSDAALIALHSEGDERGVILMESKS